MRQLHALRDLRTAFAPSSDMIEPWGCAPALQPLMFAARAGTKTDEARRRWTKTEATSDKAVLVGGGKHAVDAPQGGRRIERRCCRVGSKLDPGPAGLSGQDDQDRRAL